MSSNNILNNGLSFSIGISEEEENSIARSNSTTTTRTVGSVTSRPTSSSSSSSSISLWKKVYGSLRYLAFPTSSVSAVVGWNIESVLNTLLIYTRLELIWSMGLFIFTGWYLFFILGNLTETTGGILREKVSGWLIFLAMILTCRTISLSITIEEIKWHKAMISSYDIRPSFISFLSSNRMASTRFFYILYLFWWYIISYYIQISISNMEIFAHTSDIYHIPININNSPKTGIEPGSSSYKEPVIISPEYILAYNILTTTVHISKYLWTIEWIPLIFTIIYHLFKYRLDYSQKIILFILPSNLLNRNLPVLPFGPHNQSTTSTINTQQPPSPIPKRALKSFPLIVWPLSLTKQIPSSSSVPYLNQIHTAESVEETTGDTTGDTSGEMSGDTSGEMPGDVADEMATANDTTLANTVTFHTCTICLSQFNHGDQLRLLPCTHWFHQDCIDTWLSERANCPFRCDVDLTRPFNANDLATATCKLPDAILKQLKQTSTNKLS